MLITLVIITGLIITTLWLLRANKVEVSGNLKAKSKALVVFDFDGTLCDSLHLGIKKLNDISKIYHFNKIKDEEIPYLQDLSTLKIIHHLNIPHYKLPFIAKRMRKEMKAAIPSLKPHTNMPELIQDLKSQGYPIALLSSNSKENIDVFLHNNSLPSFELYLTSCSILGKDYYLKKIIHMAGLDPKHIYYIGDETRDIDAANKIGMQSIAVTWGYNSKKALESRNPKHICDTPKQLYDLLKQSIHSHEAFYSEQQS